ncbi:MAG: SEL1-like repeat protein [Bacteroidaceae bacterium]|nr:SEL1-like repeat protein [Bacteroidaceae bacterium]
MKRNILILLLLITATIAPTQAQVEQSAKRALVVGRSLPQERVYLQFDNNSYYLGETIWFKAHVTSGNNDKPSTMSKVLYVELVAPEGYVVQTNKYKLDDNGCSSGSLELNPLILSGYYEVRAYTRYMLNWGKDAIFSRVFPVFDKVNGNNWEFRNMLDRKRGFMYRGEWVSSDLPECDLKFYPEGGHLIDQIESTVAFELRGADGIFSNDSITIYEDKTPIIRTVPQHYGKGIFRLTPKKGARYKALVTAKAEGAEPQSYTFDLPKVEAQGATLAVEQRDGSVTITIRNNLDKEREIGFAILHRGAMGFYKKFSSAEKEKIFTLSANELLEGVSRAVVFLSDIPLAERQFFVQHDILQKNDRQTVRLTVKANNYNPTNLTPSAHEKITLSVEREDGAPIDPTAQFSVSVTDAAGNNSTSWDYNMYTYMLLGSELKGYIPNASQYFDPANTSRHSQLDLLMLTHGWTSYDWQLLTGLDLAQLQPIEKGITLKGTLYEKRKNDKFGQRGTYLLKPSKYNLTNFSISYNNREAEQSTFRTDSLGRFVLEMDDFYGKRTGVLEHTDNYRHTDNVWYGYSLDRYYSPKFRLYDYWERNTGTPDDSKAGDEMIHLNPFEYMLSSVEVVASRKKERNSRPPHSEMRFDYLDEWEYAQDITFLLNSSGEDALSDFAAEDYLSESMMDADIDSWQSENSDDLDEGEKAEEKTTANILDLYTPVGIFNMPGNKSDHGKYIGRMRFAGTNSSKLIGSNDYAYERIITAEDVVLSAMYRHNYNWAYWVQLMAVLGEYDSDSIPRPDTDYYKGKDPAKMVNFKEFVIRSDEKTRTQFENRADHWGRLATALDNKEPDIRFYLGFMSQSYLIAKEDVDNAPLPSIFMEELKAGQINNGSGTSSPLHPNYVACMIPYTETDQENTLITPDFLSTGSKRYTSIQGYTESKQFYSPDYSGAKPDASAKDYRRTLLWIPSATSSDGKLTLEFYNSSVCDAINVSINGVKDNTYYSNDPTMQTRSGESAAANTGDSNREAAAYETPTDPETLAALAQQQETADIYYNQKKYTAAVKLYAELVQYNYAPAIYKVGICYLNGQGLSQRNDKAMEFLETAAQMDYAPAMYEIALIYRDGTALAKDESQYIAWLQKAVNADYPEAQYELGNCYRTGHIVAKDNEKCATLLKASAMQGNAEGLYLYAIFMEESNTSDDTLGSALDCIKKAAEQKHTGAMLYLMHYYHKIQQYTEAYKQAKELHQSGSKEGTLYLADCYEQGRGVKRDKQLADDLRREVK